MSLLIYYIKLAKSANTKNIYDVLIDAQQKLFYSSLHTKNKNIHPD